MELKTFDYVKNIGHEPTTSNTQNETFVGGCQKHNWLTKWLTDFLTILIVGIWMAAEFGITPNTQLIPQ